MPAEQEARKEIDKLLTLAGWRVADMDQANIYADRGVAIREFPLKTGHGFADYLLYIDGKACGVIKDQNPNFYHAIGFVMGKAKANGKDMADMLLFLDGIA